MILKSELQFIKTYLRHPFQTIQSHAEDTPMKASVIMMALVSFASAAQLTILGIPSWLMFSFILFLIVGFFLFLQSVVTDFVAQLFSLKPQSLKTFYWFGLSLAPHLLFLLKWGFIKMGVSSLSWMMSLFSLGLWVFSMVLQIYVIKTLYKTGTAKSCFIYFAPVLAIFAVVSAFVILGVLIAMVFLR